MNGVGKGPMAAKKCARQPFLGAKPSWYVKVRDHARLERQPAASVLHDINSTWIKFDMQHGLHMDPSHLNVQRVQVDDFSSKWRQEVNLLCCRLPEPDPEPEPQPGPQGGSLVDALRNLWNGGPSLGDGEPDPAATDGGSPFLSL